MITERRQANVALRASEERYRSLAGLSADWYWEMDENFRFTSHQGSQPDTGSLPRSEGVIGKTRRELPFLHMTEPQWAAHQAQLDAHRAFRDFEVCRPDSNGNPTYAVVSGAPFFAEDGAFRGYRGVGRDVTAVRAVEREAKIRQELESILLVMSSRFINAAENEIDSIVLDTLREIGEFAQADRCFVNLLDKQKQTYTLVYEWCAEGIESKLASRQNVPVARTSLLWERLESNATMYMKVADLPSASPERAMLEASGIKSTLAVPVASGRKLLGCLAFDAVREVRHWGDDVVLLIRIAADIMGGIIARRTVEEALRASEEKFAKAFRLSPVYLCISTLAEGRYLEANEAMQRGIDRTHDGIVGHTATEIGMWKSLEDRNRAIELLEREGRVIGFEAELCKKSGATMPCEIWAERLEIDNVPCVLWIANDISLRKQAETEILQFNELLEQRVTMRTEELETAIKEMAAFSYSISHDLRAPLRSIVGFSQLLAESLQGQLNDENSHRLQRIVSNGSRMGLLIDEVLHYTRLARAELARRHVDLDSLVNEILNELRERYPSAQVKQYPLGQANADRTMIRQIFYNLIDNALKYSAMRAPSIIEIGASTTGDQVEYYVRDNGVGFDMSHAGHLFELFSRMHGVDEFEGIGAGLAIVKRLVERHKGHIHATAEVDKGATFSFSI
jgi:PAS domain S-box-containing protein